MRNTLFALVCLGILGLGLAVAVVANGNHALGERVLRLERSNQDLVVAIEELDAQVWRQGLELDALELAADADARRIAEDVQ